ncbi:TniB family NTP-binding protein [Thiolapillus sp.]|uniref:TniB family NTP-binding protein n=1 Tax=Thiolapillus sp. TaxID=2017437 RepID=UPI003AF69242
MTDNTFNVSQLNKALLARRIPHDKFKKAFERGKELIELSDLGMPGSGIMVFGPSGVGKTKLTFTLEEYAIKHYGKDSVVRTQLDTGATVKGAISSLLFAFGDPRSNYGTIPELSTRLKNTIKKRKCRLIIIDEVQHLIPGGKPSKTLIDNILNAFKILDDTGVSFLLAGMEDIMQLWIADEQIRSRFQTTYFFDVLTYPQDRRAWRGIVRSFIETIEQHGLTVECPEIEDRCFAASKGAIRPLVLILTTAVSLAYKSNTTIITVEHLLKAAQKQIDKNDGKHNAFDVDREIIDRFNKEAHSSRRLAPIARPLSSILTA